MRSYNVTDDRRRTSPRPAGHSTSDQAGAPEDRVHALLRRMADGDESALAALYDEMGERVYSVAFFILWDGEEAEDAAEETFWQAWRIASQYDGQRASGSTWLLMIARSRALDRLRARRRRADWTAAPSTIRTLIDQAAAGGTNVPDAQAERPEHLSALASALDALPAEQREAVEMAFYCGLSHAEIAEQTAQPLGTVKTRIRLAMQKLRQRLTFLREECP